jgi:cytochrome P450
MDPLGHTAQRRTVAPIVAPSNLLNLEPLIRKRTADVLNALPRNNSASKRGQGNRAKEV